MCLPKPKVPSPPSPVEQPKPLPVPEPTPDAPIVDNSKSNRSAQSSQNTAKRRGTRALQIPLQIPEATGQGLNIPQG